MKDTVFSPSFGNRPTHMIGRDKILRQLLDGLNSRPGDRDRAAVILGQRGSGKTVLLWEIADQARRCGFVVASPTTVSEGMLERIVEKIQDDGERYVEKRKIRVSGGSLGALGFSAGLQFSKEVQESKSFQYKLTQLARKLTAQNRGILILIDELQSNSSEVRQLVIAFQELVGEGLNVALAMAGLPGAVSQILNDRVLTFLNRARKINLEPLDIREIDAYFAHTFEEIGVLVEDDIRRKASAATQGSPYMLQLMGHCMVLYASADGRVGEKEFQEALISAQNDFEIDVCKTTLSALSEKDVEFLRAMSQSSLTAVGYKMSEITQLMGVTRDYAQQYRRRLLDAGVIEISGRGMVCFAVPFLRDYLSHK